MLRHDLTADPAPAVEFDLVHTRLVLEHLKDPAVALATLVSALRPGGWVLVESADPALQPLACPDRVGPSEALANMVGLSFWDVLGQRTHLTLGRTLPRLLRAAGLTDVNAEVAFNLGGPDARRMQRGLTMWVGPHLIADGQVSEDEISQHVADLESNDVDVALFPVVSAWGRKQPERGKR